MLTSSTTNMNRLHHGHTKYNQSSLFILLNVITRIKRIHDIYPWQDAWKSLYTHTTHHNNHGCPWDFKNYRHFLKIEKLFFINLKAYVYVYFVKLGYVQDSLFLHNMRIINPNSKELAFRRSDSFDGYDELTYFFPHFT